MKLITKNWGEIDPLNIKAYQNKSGYLALKKVLREMSPTDVIEEIKKSGLQGRGGAGCPVFLKWEAATAEKLQDKYYIVNLDESEPGTFKDRAIVDNNPHLIVEGMTIGAYAIGAKKGIIYINGHYVKQAEILRLVLEQAAEKEFIGKSIMGSAFDFEITVFSGAGAYICGEETALINSLEGKRGEPRLRPPYPAKEGLFGKPTVINNAETVANIPFIINRGAKCFNNIGSQKSPGTKLFCITGSVKNPGVHEAPLGTTPQELIFNSVYGGGLREGKDFLFAQIGGSSGRLINRSKLDYPLVFGDQDLPIGSGAIFVADTLCDIKEHLLSWAGFFHRESCGKCVPCREGTYRLWEIAKRLKNKDLRPRDSENIEDILWVLERSTFCPLGKFAATAWRDALAMFKDKIFK